MVNSVKILSLWLLVSLGSSNELESDGDFFEPVESQYLAQRNEEARASLLEQWRHSA